MPLYTYECLDCRGRDHRLAGVDDHTALCLKCRGLMLRRDEDVFTPYFREDGGRDRLRSSASGRHNQL